MEEMDPILTNAISFVISYVAGCLPVPTEGYEEHIEKCFHKALDRWNVPQAAKDNAAGDMARYLIGLKEMITHTSRGRHPKECDLLRLWAEEILGDPKCHQFILANQHEIMQEELRKGLLKVEDVLETLNQQKTELQKINEKAQQLINRGVTDASTYWERWSTGPDGFVLDYEIVLAGRREASDEVVKACYTPAYICIESLSLSDALAFAVASILKFSPENASRTLVLDNTDVYRDFSKEGTPLIIITNVHESPYYSVKNGHTIIMCGTPADKLPNAAKIVLPTVDREGFRNSLISSGIDDNKATALMQETKRESALLRRVLGINCEKEEWMIPANNKYYIPTILLGSWDETREGDKEIAAQLSGMDYQTFDKGLQALLNSNEPPLMKVGGIWQVSSPIILINRIIKEIDDDTITSFKECIDWILEDDDPDVIAKRDSTDLRFWQDKHHYSGHLRSGLLQSITAMAVVMESEGMPTDWIDEYIENKLREFSIERFLSNRQNLKWFAESSPNAFLGYLEGDIKNGSNVLNKVFEVKHSDYSLTGTEIFFCELLFCLEGLAWDVRYLPRVTALLLQFCRYPNDSNYSNKPSSSLYNIYRFLLPQTLVEFPIRCDILYSLSKQYGTEVCNLCFSLLDGIKQRVFPYNDHFRWRYIDQIKNPDTINAIPAADVIAITQLLLSNVVLDEANICKLIDLVTNDFMSCSHDMILGKLYECENVMKGNEVVVECLRSNINQHLRCRKANWALSDEQLSIFQELLSRIESDDIIVRNKHYFADYLVKKYDFEDIERDFAKQKKELRIFRKGILEAIIDTKGWDGIWEMSHVVSNVEGLAEALVELTDDGKRHDIYQLYCDDSLPCDFVRAYFRTLFYEYGKGVYLSYIDELRAISEDKLGIILYAPSVDSDITNIVDNLNGLIQKEYWENVNLWGLVPESANYAIERLRSVGRYSDILHLVHYDNIRVYVKSTTWLEILFEIFESTEQTILFKDSYYVAIILKHIDVPEDATNKGKLLILELMLFDHLRHHLQKTELHLLLLVNTEPDMMMEIVKMVYLEDEGFRQDVQLTEIESKNRLTLAQLGFNFLYHYHSVPGMQSDGTIDGEFLKDYLFRLQRLSESCHRMSVMPIIIGRILGNMPEKEDYPSDLMCELVEYFNDDHIDNEIGCCLSNRRGMSSRSPYAGGDIEREHIDTFKRYLDRALTRSPRMVKILESEIRAFEKMATKQDEQGKLTDLQY